MVVEGERTPSLVHIQLGEGERGKARNEEGVSRWITSAQPRFVTSFFFCLFMAKRRESDSWRDHTYRK